MPRISRYRREGGVCNFATSAVFGFRTGISVTVQCGWCQRIFRTSLSRYQEAKGDVRFCSWKCYKKSGNEIWSAQCHQCGLKFRRTHWRNKYCSPQCSAMGRTTRIQQECAICGRGCLKKLSALNRIKIGVTCSWKCARALRVSHLTTEYARHRYWFHRDVRQAVLVRDDYTCRRCGEKTQKLEVHHIKSFKHYKALRFVKENCITLCHRCHAEIDPWRGWKGRYAPDQQIPLERK